MRIIAGALKGRPLHSLPGPGVRPTSGRVREALFSILGESVVEAGFLDLYAGSGSVGIEALSRGASKAVFIESSRGALQVLRRNLRGCGLESRARVIAAPVLATLVQEPGLGCDMAISFMDPPYDSPEVPGALALLAKRLPRGHLVVLEHRRKGSPPGNEGGLIRFRTALYGDTALSLYRSAGAG